MLRKHVFIGADSAGAELKQLLSAHMTEAGYDVTDCGTHGENPSHYPHYAHAVASEVAKDPDGVFGILICGTGIGMSIAANKHRKVRAALCSETYSARFTRMHNDANVLCLGARVIGPGLAVDIADIFLATPFESGGRHEDRVRMITDIENGSL